MFNFHLLFRSTSRSGEKGEGGELLKRPTRNTFTRGGEREGVQISLLFSLS